MAAAKAARLVAARTRSDKSKTSPFGGNDQEPTEALETKELKGDSGSESYRLLRVKEIQANSLLSAGVKSQKRERRREQRQGTIDGVCEMSRTQRKRWKKRHWR
jgi:hypothetical protein